LIDDDDDEEEMGRGERWRKGEWWRGRERKKRNMRTHDTFPKVGAYGDYQPDIG